MEKNAKDFKKYLSAETMETHLKRLKQPRQWGTHVELKAASGVLKLPIYIYTLTLRADGQYIHITVKLQMFVMIYTILNYVIPKVHIMTCLYVLTNGTYPKDFSNDTMCM